MKKVGIMSMQRIVNYGSFLQAYGLKKMIESLGNNVQFVDYEYEEPVTLYKKKKFYDKVKNNINIIDALKRKSFSKKFRSKYNKYIESMGIRNEKNIRPKIDFLVIGSDEVFNCMQGFPVGYSRELFGKNYENIDVISYAASFGYTKIEMLEENNVLDEISQMLSKMKSISVRDENSFNIVKKLTQKEPVIHLDPVLVADFEDEVKDNVKMNNYIVLYAYPNRITKTEAEYIKKFAKKHNKKIISLGFYQRIADENLIVSPFEALEYIKKADYVITDTFHGTIFSIKMNTNFCTLIRDSNRNKLYYLLKKLKKESQIVNKIDDIEELYNKEIDFLETKKIIIEEKEKTINYLKENLIKNG